MGGGRQAVTGPRAHDSRLSTQTQDSRLPGANLTAVDDFPKRIADLLEAVTARIRGMTVDPVARVITYVTLGLVALVLVGGAVTFLLVGTFRIVGELFHKACDCDSYMEISYAVVGGVFLILGALLWRRRARVEEPVAEDTNE